MKKFKNIIAAIMTLCLVQGVWAIAPGGALGGGGKAAQRHAPQEGKVIVEPVVTVGPIVDETTMQTSAESPIVEQPVHSGKILIGKPGSEGQGTDEVGEAEFSKAVIEHDAKKAMRRQLKESIQKYRDSKKQESPTSPLDDMLVLCVILALFIPPLAVYLYLGSIGTEFWISLILTLLFFLPGVIYSLYVILTN